jgi:hypothetical protein
MKWEGKLKLLRKKMGTLRKNSGTNSNFLEPIRIKRSATYLLKLMIYLKI